MNGTMGFIDHAQSASVSIDKIDIAQAPLPVAPVYDLDRLCSAIEAKKLEVNIAPHFVVPNEAIKITSPTVTIQNEIPEIFIPTPVIHVVESSKLLWLAVTPSILFFIEWLVEFLN